MSVDMIRNRFGCLLHRIAHHMSRFAFWVEVWQCEYCKQYSRDPIPHDSFEHICPNCGKESPV